MVHFETSNCTSSEYGKLCSWIFENKLRYGSCARGVSTPRCGSWNNDALKRNQMLKIDLDKIVDRMIEVKEKLHQKGLLAKSDFVERLKKENMSVLHNIKLLSQVESMLEAFEVEDKCLGKSPHANVGVIIGKRKAAPEYVEKRAKHSF